MRFMKCFALPALALAFSAANGLMAYDRDGDDRGEMRYDRADIRHDYRDLRRDYARRDRLAAGIEHDRWQMNEAIRWGDDRAAARLAQDLARDQRSLDALDRDMRHDQRDIRRDRRDLYRDSYGYGYDGR